MIKLTDASIHSKQLEEIIASILRSGYFVNGPWNGKFIQAFSKYFEQCYIAPVASGSAALTAALKCSTVNAESRTAIIPEYTFAATAFSVLHAGLTPILCQVDSRGLMDMDELSRILRLYKSINSPKPAAIVPVHLYGQKLNIPQEICDEYNVIEDACQAVGVVIGKPQGRAACFSFHPSKNLGAAGDAGAVVSKDVELIEAIRRYCNYGDYPGREKYQHSMVGDNLRMDEIQAAVLAYQLGQENLMTVISQRKANASSYDFRTVALHEATNWHIYPILVKDCYAAQRLFQSNGIEVGRHYPYLIADVLNMRYNSSFNAERLATHELSLPVGEHLTWEDLRRVMEVMDCFNYSEAGGYYETG